MTPQKLDKAALEAATAAFLKAYQDPAAEPSDYAAEVSAAITAYLASLPPDPARALVKKAATALRPLAGLGSINMWRLGTMEDAQVVAEFDGTFVTAGDIRRARAALQSIKDADHERD